MGGKRSRISLSEVTVGFSKCWIGEEVPFLAEGQPKTAVTESGTVCGSRRLNFGLVAMC